jgi:hypothetical protein
MLACGRLMFIIFETPPAFLEYISAIGKKSLSIMEERAVSIHAPIFLAEKLQRICQYTFRPLSIATEHLPCRE